VAQSLSTLTGTSVPLLGQVPIDQQLREGGDAGVPIVTSAPESPAAVAFGEIADKLAARQRGLAGLQLGLSPAGR
jgi:ATP-binding protein involved in chromosome partitioning